MSGQTELFPRPIAPAPLSLPDATPITKTELRTILASPPDPDCAFWTRRYHRYWAAANSGSSVESAAVLRDLRGAQAADRFGSFVDTRTRDRAAAVVAAGLVLAGEATVDDAAAVVTRTVYGAARAAS